MRSTIIALTLLAIGCDQSDAPDVKREFTAEPIEFSSFRPVSTQELAKAVGKQCPAASKSQLKGELTDQVFYAVDCGAKSFLVAIKVDGSTRTVDCPVADKLGMPCWQDWE